MDRTDPTQTTRTSRRGPIGLLLGLFSSVTLGVVLMAVLFVYMTIGSAGLFYPALDPDGIGLHLETYMVRQHRLFELTEFEWFHTWFFDAVIALMCVNIIVATIRRIPFNIVNLGVWMIHSGIIILCAGSVWYFSSKLEGDAPVFRREVRIEVPGADPTTLIALPGAETRVQAPGGEWRFRVADIRPDWPILSGEDEGTKTYSVSVGVRTPDGTEFIRQLLDGFPRYTEDVIPGRGRVKKLDEFGGRALVEDSLDLSLDLMAQDTFWLKDSSALQVRPKGATEWIQRPIDSLPRYNDYVSDESHIWWRPGQKRGLPPLNIPVPASNPEDPLAGADVRVTGYLRYAFDEERTVPGDDLNPTVEITVILESGDRITRTLRAFDPEQNHAIRRGVRFEWVESEQELATLRQRWGHTIVFSLPGEPEEHVYKLTDELLTEGQEGEFIPIGDTGYSFRVFGYQDALPLSEDEEVWIAQTVIRRPDGSEFQRWIADNPDGTRDLASEDDEDASHGVTDPSPEIEARYIVERPASVVVVAGPEPIGLRVLHGGMWDETIEHEAEIGRAVPLATGQGIVINRYMANAARVMKPVIVPPQQRDRDADVGRLFAMLHLTVTEGGETHEHWLPFHKYSFPSENRATPVLSPYLPTTLTLSDGREVEVMFSREWRKLPDPVALQDFILTTRVGGFTGSTSSVRDWTSELVFKTDSGWTDPVVVSTNNPKEHAGLWYFQSYWEPPRSPRTPDDPGSAGLNFTGLGIGNRNGVYVQLFGCAVAVTGMIYAFYVKPIIKRRRRQRVLDSLVTEEATP